MVLSSKKDYFNEKRTRNEENTNIKDYNCGGYALGTFNWYLPYEKDESFEYGSNLDFMDNLRNDGYSVEEATTIILNKNVEQMLVQFGSDLREVNEEETCNLDDDEELVVYRLSVMYDEEHDDVYDMDFHFMKHYDGCWLHKNGEDEIQFYNEDIFNVWRGGYFQYNSPLRFLAHKRGKMVK